MVVMGLMLPQCSQMTPGITDLSTARVFFSIICLSVPGKALPLLWKSRHSGFSWNIAKHFLYWFQMFIRESTEVRNKYILTGAIETKYMLRYVLLSRK